MVLQGHGGRDSHNNPNNTEVNRPSHFVALQTAAAAALSLVAGRDMVVQDSVRYLGGIDLLVDLLASDDVYLAEVGAGV